MARISVAMKGNTALVTSKAHQEFEIVGTTLSEPGVAAKCVQESTSIDTWTRDYGQWQIHRSQEVQSASTIDGQPQ